MDGTDCVCHLAHTDVPAAGECVDCVRVLRINGDGLNKKIASPTGRLDTMLKAKKTPAQIVEEMYLVTLSRLPILPAIRI